MSAVELHDPDATARLGDVIRDVEHALDKLAAHGTRTAIADHLAQNDHRGHVGIATSCPVYQYVTAAVPDSELGLTIGRGGWTFYTRDGRGISGTLPEPVGAFVRRFDNDDYPDLALPGDYDA